MFGSFAVSEMLREIFDLFWKYVVKSISLSQKYDSIKVNTLTFTLTMGLELEVRSDLYIDFWTSILWFH